MVSGGDNRPSTATTTAAAAGKPESRTAMEMLHTGYASVAGPVLAFLDRLREQRAGQIVVLIPVATPDRPPYRFLHDHLGLMLAAALRGRPDIATARLPVLPHQPDRQPAAGRPAGPAPPRRRHPRAGAARAATFPHDRASGS
jgi:hypothetical protein